MDDGSDGDVDVAFVLDEKDCARFEIDDEEASYEDGAATAGEDEADAGLDEEVVAVDDGSTGTTVDVVEAVEVLAASEEETNDRVDDG